MGSYPVYCVCSADAPDGAENPRTIGTLVTRLRNLLGQGSHGVPNWQDYGLTTNGLLVVVGKQISTNSHGEDILIEP